MNTPRSIGALMIVSLALFAGACSGDSDGSEGSSTKKKETTTTEAAETTTTEAPLSDADYQVRIDEISTAIGGAGTDLCALSAVTTDGPPTPTTTAQVQSAVTLYALLLNSVADSFPAESAAKGEPLRAAATTLQTDAAAAGYPIDFFTSETSTTALSGEGYTAAMTEYQTLYTATCEAATPTVPAG